MTNKLIMEIKRNQTQLMKRKARKKENEQKKLQATNRNLQGFTLKLSHSSK